LHFAAARVASPGSVRPRMHPTPTPPPTVEGGAGARVNPQRGTMWPLIERPLTVRPVTLDQTSSALPMPVSVALVTETPLIGSLDRPEKWNGKGAPAHVQLLTLMLLKSGGKPPV